MKSQLSVFNVVIMQSKVLRIRGFEQSYSVLHRFPDVSMLLSVSLGLFVVAALAPYAAYAQTGTMLAGDTTFDISYDSDIAVLSFDSDMDWPALIVSVDAPDPGTLTVTLDEALLEFLYGGSGGQFEVLADGDLAFFEEHASVPNTLIIQVPVRTQEITITANMPATSTNLTTADSTDESIPTDVPPPVTSEQTDTLPQTTPSEQIQDEPNTSNVTDVIPTNVSMTVETDQDTSVAISDTGDMAPVEIAQINCGPGTTLQNGVCELDKTCGPGTILEDNVCVLDTEYVPMDEPASESTTVPEQATLSNSQGGSLAYGLVTAFIIAGAIGVFIALIAKASKSSKD